MILKKTKVYSLALAVASVLAGSVHAGQEISAGDKKQVIVEPQKLSGSISAGYSSRYIFRGTNLMSGSEGLTFADAHVSYGGFTLGAWFGSQQGTASVPGALAFGEGGGGGAVDVNAARGAGLDALGGSAVQGQQLVQFIGTNFGLSPNDVRTAFQQILGVKVPGQITQIRQSSQATQERFNEIDLYLQYQFSVGPVDFTLGNIYFYIDRNSTTRITSQEFFASPAAESLIRSLTGNPALLPGSTRAGHAEDFLINNGRPFSRDFAGGGDEQFDRLFVSASTSVIPYIVPRVTYYQTVYNEGQQPADELHVERNDALGGYLEIKVNGEVPLIKDRINFDPYALVSYSAGDRSEPDGSALDGWNHFQCGADLVIQITDNFRIIPQLNYMHHISHPTLGTERDDWWGGAKAEVTF